MSVIEKMTIMGIRSFGPDDRNKQLIEFFKPLTLILGPNGSGKTTIIECLRYLTTGDTPPNSEKGGSFVHDPKIAGETEVKGQVKLQIRDVLSRRVIVTRNMVATQKQKKIQLRTLDGTVTRYSENGEKTTLSSKCAEIDKEMITALGVSKPILASVIFCHQEDSNWPLSEGKNVKQKFDEIFAATRYIKALEVIRKTRQEKVVDIRLFKVQVEGLKENRRKATEFGQSLEKTKSRLAACKDAVMEIDNKLKPITDKLQNIAIKEHEIGRLNSDLESNNKVMAKLEKDEKDMKNSIEHLFEGTKEDLKQEMDNFNTVVMSKKKQLDTVKRKCSENENEQRVFQKKLSRMQEDFGKLKAGQKAHQERITARDVKLGNLGEQLGLGGLSLDTDEMMKDSEVQNVLRNWKQKLVKTQQELKFTKTKYEDTENKLQSQIDTVRDKKSQKEQNQKNCTQKIAKNKETLRNIDAELSQVDSLANRQDDLKEDLAEAEKELASLEKAVDVNTLRGKISVNQRRKRELELKLTSLNDEMFQLQKESKVRTEIDLISKDKTSKQEAVDRMLQRHRETVIHLIGNMPERNAQDNIKALVTTLSREIQEKNKELEKNRSRISSLNTSKSFLQQDLKKREELLVSHKNKIFNACGNENFDEGLDVLQKTVKELQDQKGAVEGSLFLYNEYLEKLSSRKPCCPLCERAFQKNEEIENLRQDIQRKLQLVPSQLTKKEKLIGEHQKRLNGMLELRPLKQEIRNIFEKEIPEVKSKILKVDEDLVKIVEEISDLEEILESKQCDSRTATEMLPDLAMLDQSQRELLRLERRLSTLTCQLGSSDVSRTINVVGDEQSTVQKEMDEVKNLIEASQLRISEHGEQVQRLRGQINDLRAEQVEISGRLQKKNALEDQMSVLAAENVEFANLIKEIKVELADFDKKIVELAAEKRQVKNDKEVELEKIRNKINAEQKEMDYIDGLTREIDRYVNGGKEQELTEQESKISSVNSDISAMGNELTRLDKEKDNLNKLITSQQIKFREYEDNLKLMEIHDEIKSLKSKCGKLREKIGDFDIRTFLREKRQLGDQEKQLTKERNEHEGRQSELVKQVSLLDSQLQDKVYRDADKKHKEMIIKLRTTELTCEDMNKYYAALDQAVMNHHRMKMDEINKIIRDLWIKTYSGNDIDYIEIRSNDDDTEADLTKARRIYNYRVVMMKGEIAVDMRGRCSAGQKVLASLIIRLALAETFCLNCGILALDEPTTNLDRDNIGSLAKALVEIVKSRSEQRNFQLIIITHDEDFIELLGRSDTVDYFYKVSKDENTWSRLAKCRVSEMA